MTAPRANALCRALRAFFSDLAVDVFRSEDDLARAFARRRTRAARHHEKRARDSD